MAMAAATPTITAASAAGKKRSFLSCTKHPFSSLSPNPTSTFPKSLKSPVTISLKHLAPFSPLIASAAPSSATQPSTSSNTFHGLCYVLKDNIDTDQIIPAEYLTLVPSNPDEYKQLGSFALIGLPSSSYSIPFVDPGQTQTVYSIVIAGSNFGCGSSREHAPVALGASGVRAVVAESYARIFFRNCVATGEVYPLEVDGRLCEECTTGDVVTVELDECKLINHTTGKEYKLKPIGDAGPVIEAGGIFAYARKTGMIKSDLEAPHLMEWIWYHHTRTCYSQVTHHMCARSNPPFPA